MTDTLTPPIQTDPSPSPQRLFHEISRLEWIVAAIVAAILALLVLLEPDILEAPFENTKTMVFTIGGTAIAAIVLVAMLWFRVPPVIRILVLGVPFVIVNWWLLSPFFIDDVADDDLIEVGIATEEPAGDAAAEAPADAASPTELPAGDAASEPPPTEASPPAGEAGAELLGTGSFVGLAGHSGAGDAELIAQGDGAYVLQFRNFDIQNGPDLKVYLVPGADQTGLAPGSINLGDLRGNVGDQLYQLPAGTEIGSGDYTALVWCEAFSVEFVGATITVA